MTKVLAALRWRSGLFCWSPEWDEVLLGNCLLVHRCLFQWSLDTGLLHPSGNLYVSSKSCYVAVDMLRLHKSLWDWPWLIWACCWRENDCWRCCAVWYSTWSLESYVMSPVGVFIMTLTTDLPNRGFICALMWCSCQFWASFVIICWISFVAVWSWSWARDRHHWQCFFQSVGA